MSGVHWAAPERLAGMPDCTVARPSGADGPLPILYLLHGQFDTEDTWWDRIGQLPDILEGADAIPMLIVMPFCSAKKTADPGDQQEPGLVEFESRFRAVESAVMKEFGGVVAPEKTAVMGISMGGKQALFLTLSRGRAFSALGVLSAKLGGEHLEELKRSVEDWPSGLHPSLELYFHYCGSGGSEEWFIEGNRAACADLGGQLISDPSGGHHWGSWHPRIKDFIAALSAYWGNL